MVEKTSGDDCGDPSLYHVDTRNGLSGVKYFQS